jgi:quercetin dioxygenase-like cupin family protein
MKENAMPIFKSSQVRKVPDRSSPLREFQTMASDFLKGGIVTYQKGHFGSKPHIHPNEEEIAIILEGRLYFMLGDDEQIIGPGDITLIPRNIPHGSIPLGEKVVKFVVKSPIGTRDVSEDVNIFENADEILEGMRGRLNQKEMN